MQQSKSNRVRMAAAGVATAALAIAGLGVMATPSTAAVDKAPFKCKIGLLPPDSDPIDLTLTMDTDLPATTEVGAAKSATLTATAHMDAELAGLLYLVGARKVDAKIDGSVQANTAVHTYSAEQKAIANTEAAFDVKFSSPLAPAVAAATPGPVGVKSGNFSLVVKLYDAAGDPLAAPLDSVNLDCSPDPSKPASVIDTMTVNAPAPAPAPAATKTTVKAKALKGKAKVTVSVAGKAASGKVTVSLKGKKGKAKKATGTVKNGKAVVTVKKLTKGKYKITAAYAGDAANAASTGKGKVTIKK